MGYTTNQQKLRATYSPEDFHAKITQYVSTGDRELLNTILAIAYARHEAHVRTFIGSKIGDYDRAQDLTQETFLRVANNLHRFRPGKTFSTWLYVIASNLAKNELRSRSHRIDEVYSSALTAEDGDDLYTWAPDTHPDRSHEEDRLYECIDEALMRIPEHHARAVRLVDLEGRTYAEAAVIEGTKVGTVKSRLFRGRSSLEALVRPQWDNIATPYK